MVVYSRADVHHSDTAADDGAVLRLSIPLLAELTRQLRFVALISAANSSLRLKLGVIWVMTSG